MNASEFSVNCTGYDWRVAVAIIGSVRVACLMLTVAAAVVLLLRPVAVRAQADEVHAPATLDTLESLVGWHRPDPDMRTDIRVLTRSTIGFVPLPLVRLTGDDNDHVMATVTEWGAPDTRADGRALFF